MTHATCNHEATPAARRRCRAARRADIMAAQAAYQKACDSNEIPEIREYEAMVDIFAYRWSMDLADAYNLIEQGPIVI